MNSPVFAWLVPSVFGVLLAVAALRGTTQRAGDGPFDLGAGYLLGWLVLPLTLWFTGPGAHATVTWAALSGAVVLLWIARRRFRAPRWAGLSWETALVTMLALAVLWKLVLMTGEVSLRPLYPWDAWAAWSVKAKAWYFSGEMTRFAEPEAWFAAAPGSAFTNSAEHYPPSLPLMQLWMAKGAGVWDERYLGWPWPGAYVALTLVFWGALRRARVSLVQAGIATYVVAAAPLVTAHVALAGYADLWVAGWLTLGVAALAVDAPPRRIRWGWWLAAVVALPLLKLEGWIWSAILIGLALLRCVPLGARRDRVRAAIAAALALLLVVVAAAIWLLTMGNALPMGLKFELHAVGRPFLFAMFASSDWGMLWYLIVAGLILSLRAPLATAPRLALGFAVFATVSLGGLFGFTNAGEWAERQTALSRLLLQCGPALFLLVNLAVAAAGNARHRKGTAYTPPTLQEK